MNREIGTEITSARTKPIPADSCSQITGTITGKKQIHVATGLACSRQRSLGSGVKDARAGTSIAARDVISGAQVALFVAATNG